jgi:hypothetical protein
MIGPAEKLTIATSSGLIWLALIVHFGAGLLGLGSGFLAIVVAKGGRSHRRAGVLFVVSMVAMGVFGAGLGAYENKIGSAIGGIFTAYFVLTGFATVTPLGGRHAHAVNVSLALLGTAMALGQVAGARSALEKPVPGVPTPMVLFLCAISILATIGDWRLLRAGSITGTRRLARHLWRMCFGLFIASGSFFLGQMKFLPEPLRILPVLLFLGISPLIVLVYWMWRVRLRKRLGGMKFGATSTPTIPVRVE